MPWSSANGTQAGAIAVLGTVAIGRPIPRREAQPSFAWVGSNASRGTSPPRSKPSTGSRRSTRPSSMGQPAGLLGTQARALALEAAGRHDDVRRIGATLIADLDRGRWLLSQAQYTFAREQAVRWLDARTTAAATTPRP